MTAPIAVTTDHMARAYAQMRKHGTPPLEVLREHWAFFNCLRGRALGIAQGKTLPPEPTATPPPTVRTTPSPERRRDDRHQHHHHHQPQPTAAYDCKRAAAGDLDDDKE